MPYEKVWNIHETAAEKNGKSVSGSIFGDFIAERGSAMVILLLAALIILAR